MKLQNFLIISFIVVFLPGCSDYQVNEAPVLVVEGWIEEGRYPVVLLTTSVPVSQTPQKIDELDQYLIRWAHVAVSDGEKEVILTGKYDENYFPPYIYTTSQLKGETGKKYQLQIKYKDFSASATTTIPAPMGIDSFRISKISADKKGELFGVMAYFEDAQNEKDYYKFFSRVTSTDKVYRSSYLGAIDDAFYEKNISVPIYRGNVMNETDNTPYFYANDTVWVRFAHVDACSFQFWHEYDKLLSLSRNQFTSYAQNLPTNLTGAIGYWCGYGSSYYEIDVQKALNNGGGIKY